MTVGQAVMSIDGFEGTIVREYTDSAGNDCIVVVNGEGRAFIIVVAERVCVCASREQADAVIEALQLRDIGRKSN
jgi:hypothetical protein